MYAFAWPISGLFMCALAAILGEMASTYPVAGAQASEDLRGVPSRKLTRRVVRRHVHLGVSPMPELEAV